MSEIIKNSHKQRKTSKKLTIIRLKTLKQIFKDEGLKIHGAGLKLLIDYFQLEAQKIVKQSKELLSLNQKRIVGEKEIQFVLNKDKNQF